MQSQRRIQARQRGARPSGRVRLLDAAIEMIEEQGASALRVSELVDRADVSLGLIAHHFGSREGLVAVAQSCVFEEAVEDEVESIEQTVQLRPSRSGLVEGLRNWSRQTLDPGREAARFQRVAALGAAHGEAQSNGLARHPSARELLSEASGDLLDRITRLIRELQGRGLVRSDLDARALATFMNAFSLGAVIADLDPQAPPRDELLTVVNSVLESFLTPAGGEVMLP